MSLLNKYLKKIGVKSFADLSEEEKETFRDWEEALSGRKITDDDVADFLVASEDEIIKELIGLKNDERRDIFLKMQLDLIRKIKVFLSTPELEKKLIERNINNLMNN